MRERLESILAAWGQRAYRHPRLTIGLVLASLLPMFSQLPQLELNATTEALLHGTDPTRVAYDRFREQFGRDDLILIAIAGPEVFDFDFLEKLREMHRDIETEVPHLEDVRSLVNARDTRGAEDELIVGDLLEDWPTTPAELETIKRRALANPLYRNLLLSEDGRITTISIELDAYSSLGIKADELGGFGDDETQARPPITGAESEQIILAIESIVDRYRAADFVIYVAGAPVLVHALQAAMRADMARFTLLAIAAIVFFLYALFRNVAAAILPLLVVIPSLLTTLSIMAMTGLMISIPTQILPSFLLAVGVGNSVHILAIFYQERRRGADEESAISFALGHSGLAVVMTSLTTAGGLISFSAAEIAPIAEFGIIGPVGVMISLLLTVVALPALISLAPMGTPRSAGGQGPQLSQRWLMRAGDFSVRNAGVIVVAVGVLLVVALLGALRIQFS
ncbi:MAG: MMPL family transporter, partial [Myxococcota bacterium]